MSYIPSMATGATAVGRTYRTTPNWLKAIYATLVVILAVFALALILAPSQGLPQCTHEDGSGQSACYWDADTQGNGKGTDYVKR